MNVLKQLQNNLKGHHVLFLLAVVVAAVAVYQYSTRKSGSVSGFDTDNQKLVLQNQVGPAQALLEKKAIDAEFAVKAPVPQAGLGANEVYSAAGGLQTSTHGLPPGCLKQATTSPGDLLPKDLNTQFGQLNPQGAGDLQAINLLKAGHHMGINTVGSSLRNANLQVRSEPPNPQLVVSPWSNSTIAPDLMRIPFELGCGPQ